MTPKEKSAELFEKFIQTNGNSFFAKDCALIAVNYIIESSPSLPILGDGGTFGEDIGLSKIYWQEVKQEINKL